MTTTAPDNVFGAVVLSAPSYDGGMILLTGFEPFADHAVNPTAQIARALHGKTINGLPVVAAVLPVSRAEAWPMLAGLIEQHRPTVVLATGVSNRPHVSLERIARNVDDYPIPDNTGERVAAQPIVADAAGELHTSLDTAALRDALWHDGYAAEVSDDAGTYLCNHVYYRLLHHAATSPSADYRAAFVHLPRVEAGGDPHEHLPLVAHVAAWMSVEQGSE